ncbi:hypothetical protein QJS66_04345 [Kocuria rhizophila]|nr:hypothetical protein QJS66_04345 [Kocuria rhizophila]
MRSAAAYRRGNQENQQLQQYGAAWPSKDELKACGASGRAEARRHPQWSWTSSPSRTAGLRPARVPPPRAGSSARRWSFARAPRACRVRVRLHPAHHQGPPVRGLRTPRLVPGRMSPDASSGPETGELTEPGQDYYLKPMNCPMHNLIYRSADGPTGSCRLLRLFESSGGVPLREVGRDPPVSRACAA